MFGLRDPISAWLHILNSLSMSFTTWCLSGSFSSPPLAPHFRSHPKHTQCPLEMLLPAPRMLVAPRKHPPTPDGRSGFPVSAHRPGSRRAFCFLVHLPRAQLPEVRPTSSVLLPHSLAQCKAHSGSSDNVW